jgi:hypothetical protein
VLVINSATNNPANVALWRPSPTDNHHHHQQQQQGTQPSSSTADPAAAAAAAAADANGGSSGSSGGSWLPWVLQVRSNPATGQVDVITAATREGVQEQAAAGGDMQREGWFVWIDAVNMTPRVQGNL